jgi:CheY-like chemotaxis protein
VSAGFRAVAAADGLNALALLDQTKVDVVVLDLGLPRVSGWDVYRDLRSRPYMAELPIIIVTGNDLRDIPPQELSSFLQKPVDPERLVAAVDQALGFV